MNMKHFYLLALLPLAFCASVFDIDANEDLDEAEFEDKFGLEKVTDPEEYKKREEALKANEELQFLNNKPFVGHGKLRWIGKILVLWTNNVLYFQLQG